YTSAIESGSSSPTSVSTIEGQHEKHTYFDGLGRQIQIRTLSDPLSSQYSVRGNEFGADGNLKHQINPYLSLGSDFSLADSLNTTGTTFGYNSRGELSQSSPDLVADDGLGNFYFSWEKASSPHAYISTDSKDSVDETISQGSVTNFAFGSNEAGSERTELKTLTYFNSGDVVKELKNSSGNTFTSRRNSLGQLISDEAPGRGAVTYSYTPSGELEELIDGAGRIARFEYDGLGRTTKVVRAAQSPTPETTFYSYDTPTITGFNVPLGYLAEIDGPNDAVSYSYDAFGQLNAILHSDKIGGKSYLFSYLRDPQGRIAQISTNLITLNYEYDSRGYIKRVSAPQLQGAFPDGDIVNILKRDARGNIVERLLGNGSREVLEYHNSSGMKASYSTFAPGGATSYAVQFIYDTRDLISKIETWGGSYQRTSSFEYDARKLLKKLSVNNQDYFYDHDQQGRLIRDTQNHPNVQEFRYQSTSRPYLTSDYGTTQYKLTYNQNKDVLQNHYPFTATSKKFTYTEAGDLRSVKNADGTEVFFLTSVTGGFLRIYRQIGAAEISQTYIAGGIYEIRDNDGEVTEVIHVPGETVDGDIGSILDLNYYHGFISQLLQGGDTHNPNPGGGALPGSSTPPRVTEPQNTGDRGLVGGTPHPTPSPTPGPIDDDPVPDTIIFPGGITLDENGNIIGDPIVANPILCGSLQSVSCIRPSENSLEALVGIETGSPFDLEPYWRDVSSINPGRTIRNIPTSFVVAPAETGFWAGVVEAYDQANRFLYEHGGRSLHEFVWVINDGIQTVLDSTVNPLLDDYVNHTSVARSIREDFGNIADIALRYGGEDDTIFKLSSEISENGARVRSLDVVLAGTGALARRMVGSSSEVVSISPRVERSAIFNEKYSGIREASEYLRAIGVPRRYRKDTLEAFVKESVVLRRANANEYVIRYFDDLNRGPKGHWVYPSELGLLTRDELAILPEWNRMTYINQMRLKPDS
ncbi:MAG: RHS repeat protein, partial [Bdellovibrionales bacterium]|nr:RHS repeat protein [Bdellovibrionales bacterium]